MSDHSDYFSESAYAYSHFSDLNPAFLRLAVLSAGFRCDLPSAPAYLELGFGQGLSLNLHAAACAGEFWGVDFMAEHAANAGALASASGSGVRILGESFADFAARDDTPDFDIIALHGVWSWISDENRAVIVDIARRKLRPGGVFFVTYNCTPGWSALTPLRHLLMLHAERGQAPAPEKVARALDFAQGVADAGEGYFRSQPSAAALLAALRGRDPAYVAHEYFGRAWRPMFFSEAAEHLAPAGLSFAGSTLLFEHVRRAASKASAEALANLDDPILRESVRDGLNLTRFRKDVFVKNTARLAHEERRAHILPLRFLLTAPASEVSPILRGPGGEVALDAADRELVSLLAENGHTPKSIADLHARRAIEAPEELFERMLLLTAAGYVLPIQDGAPPDAAARCAALNAHLITRARESGDIKALASPVIGGGVTAWRVPQLFLLARSAGKTTPREWAEFARPCLEAEPRRSLGELIQIAETFERKYLPILRSAGVVS